MGSGTGRCRGEEANRRENREEVEGEDAGHCIEVVARATGRCREGYTI